jgi:two-component system, cell cycle response regulator CpdR
MENTFSLTNKMIPRGPTTMPTILVVNHDPDIRMLLKTAVDWQGYNVLVAQDGADAFAICSMDPLADVIVCDTDTPATGGLALIEKIQRLAPGARVIASTGGHEEDLRRARAFGVVRATLPKPYLISEFWAILERVLYDGGGSYA